MINLCEICECEYQDKHGCGDTCFCEICPECESYAKGCGCNAGTMTDRKDDGTYDTLEEKYAE